MIRLDDIVRRNEGLGDFADLRNGVNLRPRRRGLPWGAVLEPPAPTFSDTEGDPMMVTMIAVDETEFRALISEVRALRERLDGATITPRPEWLTIAQAAEALGVSRDTIRRRINSGELEARGSGKTRRVRLGSARDV